jgi:hypothetical protein
VGVVERAQIPVVRLLRDLGEPRVLRFEPFAERRGSIGVPEPGFTSLGFDVSKPSAIASSVASAPSTVSIR